MMNPRTRTSPGGDFENSVPQNRNTRRLHNGAPRLRFNASTVGNGDRYDVKSEICISANDRFYSYRVIGVSGGWRREGVARINPGRFMRDAAPKSTTE